MSRLAAAFPPDEADRLGICLVSDRQMRVFNRRHRGKDASTDVLSFPAGDPDPEGGLHLGDIVVSIPRAETQARQAGHRFDRELRLLLLHGYLHLLGYDHECDGGAMRRLERRLVRRLLPIPHRGSHRSPRTAPQGTAAR